MAKDELEGWNDIKKNVKKIRAPLHVAAIFFSGLGVIATIIMVFLLFQAADNAQSEISAQISDAKGIFEKASAAITDVGSQLDGLNKSMGSAAESVASLKNSLKSTGSVLSDFGTSIGSVDLGQLFSLKQQGDAIKKAGNDLLTTSQSFGELAANLQKQQGGMITLKNKIKSMQDAVKKQKDDLDSAATVLEQIFSNAKIAIVAFGIILILLFGGVMAIAVAGLAQ